MASAKEMFVTYKYPIIGAVLALVLTSWLGWYFSDTQVIKRQLIGLSWDVSKEEPESTMETVIKMRSIKSVLAGTCQVVIPERNHIESIENDLIIQYLMHYRGLRKFLTVTFEDMRIDIQVKGEAVVQSTVLLRKQENQDAPIDISASVKLGLKKQNGEWLLHHAEIPEVLF